MADPCRSQKSRDPAINIYLLCRSISVGSMKNAGHARSLEGPSEPNPQLCRNVAYGSPLLPLTAREENAWPSTSSIPEQKLAGIETGGGPTRKLWEIGSFGALWHLARPSVPCLQGGSSVIARNTFQNDLRQPSHLRSPKASLGPRLCVPPFRGVCLCRSFGWHHKFSGWTVALSSALKSFATSWHLPFGRRPRSSYNLIGE